MADDLRARLAAFAAARGWSRLRAARELLRRALDAADTRSAGGKARAANQTAEQRQAQARKAAAARWGAVYEVIGITYDERRTSHLAPCQCGQLFTHPERCAASGRCEGEKHPHAKPVSRS